jgi:hypothetical protein
MRIKQTWSVGCHGDGDAMLADDRTHRWSKPPTFTMGKRKFQAGDRVTVIGLPTINFAPGVKDELGTEELFRSMLGKVYTVRGFDRYGHVELQPKRLSIVWIEPELLKLRERKSRNR